VDRKISVSRENMALGIAFKNNNRLFYYSFYGFGIFYCSVFYFFLDKFPITSFYPILLTGIFLCFVFSFLIKYVVEKFIQKRKVSIFLPK